jgi:hypothetical protein
MLMLHPCRTQEFMREAFSLATASATCAADAASDGDHEKGGASGGGQGERGERDEEDTGRYEYDTGRYEYWYLVMWLSVFGGAVGLRQPLQLLAALR